MSIIAPAIFAILSFIDLKNFLRDNSITIHKKFMLDLQNLTSTLREELHKICYVAEYEHVKSCDSILDILVTLYFGEYIQLNPEQPDADDRNYLVLSKGHAAPALYTVLAELGCIEKEFLYALRQADNPLQSFPTIETKGVEIATGGLGQGLSAAVGIALGLKKDAKKNTVFCIVGDGELAKGQMWEAIECANKYELSNLITIVDANGTQLDGNNEEIMPLGNIQERFTNAGWNVVNLKDGNDIELIKKALNEATEENKKPSVVIAKTKASESKVNF